MADAMQADWEQAKALYLQGLNATEIAAKTGVTPVALRKRASRHRWTVERLQVTGSLSSKQAKAIPCVRPALQRKISALVDALPDKPPAKGLRGIADTTLTITHAAKLAFGWEDSTTVHMDIYALSAPMVTALPQATEVPAVTTDSTVTDAEVVHDSNVSDSQSK